MTYSKPHLATTDDSLKLVQGQVHHNPSDKSESGCLDNSAMNNGSSTGAYEVDE
jgi:hypothetical protein